ncbi:MAG: type IV pilus assembly protein PilB [Bacillota bacterium]|nr:MAG: type IV pilus assembly protein PilB [Bacillota bacterium]
MSRKKLGEILLEDGVITREQLEHALNKAGGARLGESLLAHGYISEEKLAQAIAKQFGLRFVLLRDITPDQEAVKLLSAATARRYQVVPLARAEKTLRLATANPMNVLAVDDIALITGFNIEMAVMTTRDIERALARLYADSPVHTEVAEVNEAEATPVVRMVNRLITQAVQERASDIHMEPQDDAIRVRYRIDGVLQDISKLDKEISLPLISRIKIMAGLDISERRLPQDGALRFTRGSGVTDLRVSTLPTITGEKVVMRILNSSEANLSLSDIGLLPDSRAAVERMLRYSYGMILITGPTGSGKTTSLYSALAHLHTPDKNICTVEDPVEFRVQGLNQVNVNPKIGLSFANVLRSLVRQDPDVILVGEIRDYETADIAVRSALTGHLVLSSIHTNDAPSTITRLSEMGVEPFLIASSVVGVIAQRLVRKLCLHCKKPTVMMASSPELLALGLDPSVDHHFYGPVGCDKCGGEGYRGRFGVFEVLSINEEIRDLIASRANTSAIRAASRRQGGRSIQEDGIIKAKQGLTTITEILRVAFQEG